VALDILDYDAVKNCIKSFEPTHVIHTAALTNVDACEENPELCREINFEASKNLFAICQENNCHFQLLSTDFVFDGEKGNYSEIDGVKPLSIYGKSKADAEKCLLESNYENWSIVRTIIVYGQGNNLSRSNLVLWAMTALPKGEAMNIVNDQFRAITWADDLAWGCIRICELNKRGIYHLAGPETNSIAEIIRRIALYFGWSVELINEISSSTLNQAAARPPITGFDLTKAKTELGYEPMTIELALERIQLDQIAN
jgi:dTDP-4-dehydrorhamnose reductase